MTKTFDEWLNELRDIIDEHGALTIDQLKEGLKAIDECIDVKHEFQETVFPTLTDLLTEVCYRCEGHDLWARNPVIVISQNEEGNFVAWITAEQRGPDSDPPTLDQLYSLTHDMTAETVELMTHPRDCSCPSCKGD